MNQKSGFLSRLSVNEQRILALPATLASGLVVFTLVLSCIFPFYNRSDCTQVFILGVTGLAYITLLYWIILPIVQEHAWLHWPVVVVNGLGTAVVFGLSIGNSNIALFVILTFSVLIVSATLAGRWPSYLYISVTAFASYWVSPVTFQSDFSRWILFLGMPFLLGMVVETVFLLWRIIKTQMRRLEILNHISCHIATTIEPDEVITLINEAIKDTQLADSYFIGTLREGKLRLELFYDDGELFPSIDLPLDGSLSGWVVNNRRSLLIRDLSTESEKYGLRYQAVGQPKLSLSWMGTTMESGGEILGVIAMASYRRNAFNASDLALLESIAKQAALVIDNAYHHAEVEEQSRRDSLTQAYNHGYFLYNLEEFVQYARDANTLISLIMMDIDLFKQYNDNYGHLLGDQVLIEVVKAIRESIRSTDFIGRWGGEEFAILLPDANGFHASQVAERIRHTLRNVVLSSPNGSSIPAPTISQGIAVCPVEADDAEKLIHLADQRLYLAKERGRNQIEPDNVHWESLTTESVN